MFMMLVADELHLWGSLWSLGHGRCPIWGLTVSLLRLKSGIAFLSSPNAASFSASFISIWLGVNEVAEAEQPEFLLDIDAACATVNKLLQQNSATIDRRLEILKVDSIVLLLDFLCAANINKINRIFIILSLKVRVVKTEYLLWLLLVDEQSQYALFQAIHLLLYNGLHTPCVWCHIIHCGFPKVVVIMFSSITSHRWTYNINCVWSNALNVDRWVLIGYLLNRCYKLEDVQCHQEILLYINNNYILYLRHS